jgi:hypothetical protein
VVTFARINVRPCFTVDFLEYYSLNFFKLLKPVAHSETILWPKLEKHRTTRFFLLSRYVTHVNLARHGQHFFLWTSAALVWERIYYLLRSSHSWRQNAGRLAVSWYHHDRGSTYNWTAAIIVASSSVPSFRATAMIGPSKLPPSVSCLW